ncbi:WD40-like Beta Propeller Repeat [Lysobacter spongiicola DSM 21749]|uniref:WD40-like Beta Propeller Repeat n=2 Tax=Novilysobacter TaxID=3382699 RepID=A0A1T4QGQ8_9GAMM|nr:WD40-like Beta Propeller Repeat [Lysobacter spongiicola DSM 21749]
MVDQHQRGTSPGREPGGRLRVGGATVDLASREVTGVPGRPPGRLTPKSLAVLEVLAARPGEVVTRGALLSAVWPDTMPTDDVLTQAVTQLRRMLSGRGDPLPCIDTIAKTGYRLAAPVEWETHSPVVAPGVGPGPSVREDPGTARPGRSRMGMNARRLAKRGSAGLAGIAVVAAAMFIWIDRDAGDPQPTAAGSSGAAAPLELLTSAPGYELGPSLSPDASLVAYSATRRGIRGTAIMVQATGQATPRQLTYPPQAVSDRLPAWSPDGRDIAYARDVGGNCEIRIAAVDGGADRAVARCHSDDLLSFSWAPDGGGLLFGSMMDGGEMAGVRILDLANGQWRRLQYGRKSGDLDHVPRYSPDGASIVFVRNPQRGDLWRIAVEGGDPERLTEESGEIRGWDWMPDGSIVFSRRMGSGTRLFRLEGAGRPATGLGILDAQNPDVSPDGAMAFERRQSRFGIYRFGHEGGRGSAVGAAEAIFPSSGRDTQPSLAPDGTQLVFTSDRSGRYAAWWARTSEPDSLRLFQGFTPSADSFPQWSQDSRRILMVGKMGERGVQGLHEIDVSDGSIKRLQVPGGNPIGAAFALDDRRLLVVSERPGSPPRLLLLDSEVEPWRELGDIGNVSTIRVDRARERVLFTRVDEKGLWQADLDLSPGSVARIDTAAPSQWRRHAWTVDAATGDVLQLVPRPRCSASLEHIGGETRHATTGQPRCLQPQRLAHVNGFSAGGQDTFASIATMDGTDIAFMAAVP